MQASFWRIVGTLVGAFVGWAALAAGDGSPYLLAVFAVILGMSTHVATDTMYVLTRCH